MAALDEPQSFRDLDTFPSFYGYPQGKHRYLGEISHIHSSNPSQLMAKDREGYKFAVKSGLEIQRAWIA